MSDKFDITPYEELPIEQLGIEELESRLEMSSISEDITIMISVEVAW
jgi:hypothetical protein